MVKNTEDKLLTEVKVKISKATSVANWNEIRKELKTQYPKDTISALDASGYITEVQRENQWQK